MAFLVTISYFKRLPDPEAFHYYKKFAMLLRIDNYLRIWIKNKNE